MSGGMDHSLLKEGLARVQREVDSVFDAILPIPNDSRARLVEAMRYATIGGGKRVRPLLLVSTAELFGVNRDAALRAAWRCLRASFCHWIHLSHCPGCPNKRM